MVEIAGLAHYITIALAVSIPAVGVGIGQGWTSIAALDAIDRQPTARNDIIKIAIFGMALIETAAVMGAFVAIMLLLGAMTNVPSYHTSLCSIGIAFAIAIPGFTLGPT